MNITIIISTLARGGAQRQSIILGEWLRKNEHNSEIVYFKSTGNNRYDTDSVPCINLADTYKSRSIVKNLHLYDKEHNVDVYIVMGVPLCIYVMPALCGTKSKVIVSERSDPRRALIKWYVKLVSRGLMRFADGYVFLTEEARDYYGSLKKKSAIIPISVAHVPYVKKRKANAEREKIIVTAGRLVPSKNQRMLIEAFARVNQRLPEYSLHIYGEGPLKEELQEFAKKAGVAEKVVFKGAVSNLHEQIIDDELFVMTSDFEGWGNSLMEAMAMGMTCISTDCPCGGPRTLICEGVNGRLIPVGSVDACEKTMEYALLHKPESDDLGEKALSVREEYNNDTICSKWVDYLSVVCNN